MDEVTYPKVMVPRMTLGLPVPVMRGIVARLVVLKCRVEARRGDLANEEDVEERETESIRLNMKVEARRYRT